MKKGANIKDVAIDAGVSTTTVSYIINGRLERISPQTVQRVRDSIEKLNYMPSLAAQSLSSNRSRLIGVVIPQTEEGKVLMFSNPFYGAFLGGFEYVARQNGYHVLITGTEANEKYFNIVRRRNLDGVVVVGTYPDEFYEGFRSTKTPIVIVDSYGSGQYFHTVMINDRRGGYIAARYLLDNGHKNIAFVAGQIKEVGVNSYRYQGYKDALKENDLPLDERFVYFGEVTYDYGVSVGKAIAQSNLPITGIFVTADIMALGVIKGLQEMGKRVPDDYSVIGFDDLYVAKICQPSLTTVHQDVEKKGEAAAQLVIDDNAKSFLEKQDIILPVHIVERESVRRLNG